MNIAISTNEKYIKYACVMLTSLCVNNPVHIDAYILNGGGLSDGIDDLKDKLEKYDITLYDVALDKDAFLRDCPVSDDWTVEAYFRFYIPWIEIIKCERILYLDVDIIVNGSLSEFYNSDFEDADIIAAKDCNGEISLKALADIRTDMLKELIPDDGYFNSGVMLMNLDKIRRVYEPDVYEKAIRRWEYRMIAFDQDILNYVHAGKVKYCDWQKYDLFARNAHKSGISYEKVKNSACIVHFAGAKPWNSINQLHYDIEKLWWDYAFLTPFARELSEEYIFQSSLDQSAENAIKEMTKKNDDLTDALIKMKDVIQKLGQKGSTEDISSNTHSEQCKLSSDYLEYVHPKKDTKLSWEETLTAVNYDLTVIIPCYNQERFIIQCVDSVLDQKTDYKLKIVIIDDGSCDSSPDLLKRYSEYENVFVIRQENSGVSEARNRGLLEADSRYVMFLDGDDMLAADSIDGMLKEAVMSDADVIEYGYCEVSDDASEEDVAISNSECAKTYGQKPFKADWDDFSGYVWGKIIRRHLFDHVCFPVGYWFEDSIIQGIVLQMGRSLYRSEKKTYLYRQNPEGATQKAIGDIRSVESLYLMERIEDLHTTLGICEDVKWYEFLLRWTALTYVRLLNLDDNVKTAVFFKTAELISTRFKNFYAAKAYLKVMEKGLREYNYNIYREGCIIAWNSILENTEH